MGIKTSVTNYETAIANAKKLHEATREDVYISVDQYGDIDIKSIKPEHQPYFVVFKNKVYFNEQYLDKFSVTKNNKNEMVIKEPLAKNTIVSDSSGKKYVVKKTIKSLGISIVDDLKINHPWFGVLPK